MTRIFDEAPRTVFACPWDDGKHPWVKILDDAPKGYHWRCVERGMTGHAEKFYGENFRSMRVGARLHGNTYGHAVSLGIDGWVAEKFVPDLLALDTPPY